jgi:hypothetical protein
VKYVVGGDWVDVMNVHSIENLVTFTREISSEVSSDDMITQVAPLPRRVERLVQMSLVRKRLFTDNARQA